MSNVLGRVSSETLPVSLIISRDPCPLAQSASLLRGLQGAWVEGDAERKGKKTWKIWACFCALAGWHLCYQSSVRHVYCHRQDQLAEEHHFSTWADPY
jgi:hypothetical protein